MRALVPPWWPDDDEPPGAWKQEPDVPEVESDPNPVVARLLAADGSPLIEVLERATVPLGYHPGDRQPTRLVRHYEEKP